ncbi:hypothetical protein [Streptomyces tendae]|uniref:hypothetical protein n=1 Tax=Streptomyces tendae TaxID=1932 RepID=UPI0037223F1B
MRNSIRSAIAFSTLAVSAAFAQPAQAATVYEKDGCTSSGNKYCFAIYYNSRSENTWHGMGACYIANKSIPNHYGYSPNGATLVRLVYGYNSPACYSDAGSGEAIKNNAASVANAECSVINRVYFNSGYMGTSQSFWDYCGSYSYAENLKADLKNNNASHKRN